MSSPPLPRPVTPPLRIRGVAVALIAIVALGGLLAWTGSHPSKPATGTAVLLEERAGQQVVSVLDGPEPGRHVVSWADGIPPGEQFTVGLVGECGCRPSPAALVPRDRGGSAVSAVAGSVLGLVALALLALFALIRRTTRRAQRRARAVVGHGPGDLVHVLPYWSQRGAALCAELWAVDGESPLGQVVLGTTEQGFDPTQPFRAWGALVAGQPVALTSIDERQLVLPRSALLRVLPPGPPGPVTATAATLLGWPTRVRPGVAVDLTPFDAAVDLVRSNGRRALAVFAAAFGVILAAAVLPLPALARLGLLAVAMVGVLGAVVRHGHLHAPVRALVEPVVGRDPRLVAHVANAVMAARQTPR